MHFGKLTHAEDVERDGIVCDRNARALWPCCEELSTHHLIPVEIEGAEIAFPYSPNATVLYGFRGLKVGVWIVVDPVMIDWNVSTEHAIIDHLHARQGFKIMMPPICQQHLRRLERLDGDNGIVVICVQILIPIHIIPLVLVLEHICRKRLPCENVSAVAFISQDIADGAFAPFVHAGLRRA